MRNLKGYRKIVVNGEKYYWKMKFGYYIWLYLYSVKENKMKRMYCDNHYHKEDGSIVQLSITPSVVSGILKDQINEITPEIIIQYTEKSKREKKLKRILK